MSPAMAGGFSTTAAPGEPESSFSSVHLVLANLIPPHPVHAVRPGGSCPSAEGKGGGAASAGCTQGRGHAGTAARLMRAEGPCKTPRPRSLLALSAFF